MHIKKYISNQSNQKKDVPDNIKKIIYKKIACKTMNINVMLPYVYWDGFFF